MFAVLAGFPGGAAAEELRIGGTGSALGTMQLLARQFGASHPDIRVKIVPSLGSGGGIKAVAAGAIDLAVSSRPIDAAERMLGIAESEYGRTPFVLAVSSKSAVTAITVAQLADIYAGRLETWPDGSPVRPLLRPANDADTVLLSNISPEVRLGLALAAKRPGIRLSLTDQDAADDLERIPGAIGPTSLSLILSERRQLRALRLDGKAPTADNLASGAYPYFKRMFLVTGVKRSAAAETFIALVHSPAGRKLLADHGHWIP